MTAVVCGGLVYSSSGFLQAQDTVYIQHKPTGAKMQVCAGDNGKPVTSRPSGNTGACVQWERIPNGDFFHIRSVHANKLIKPDTSENGSPISIQPLAWTGNWTQWSYEDRGDGFGHIINRATGKLIFLSGKDRDNLVQQPASWRGDFTRWAFVPLASEPTPNPETPTPTPDSPTPTTPPTTPPTLSPTPTPTDGPAPGSTTMESESGVMEGNAATFDDGAASGGQGVAFVFELGDSVSYTNVPAADSLTIRYASENANGKLSVDVNGADVGDISFSGTGAWVGSYADATMDVNIPSNATVRIFFDSGDSAMNMDTITFTLSGPTPTSAPSATPDPNVTDSPLPTPSATPSCCDCGDKDPVADFGDGMVVGITNDGIAYHRERNGTSRGFAIWGLKGSAPNQVGNSVTHTTQAGDSYLRYETDLGSVTAGESYTLEMRLQGDEFGGGQCIQEWTLTPGEGLTASNCFSTGTGGPVEPPPPPSATAMVITDGNAGLARLVGGPGSSMPGFALYTFGNDGTNTSNCSGTCEDNWPKLIVANENDAISTGGVTGDFSTIPRVRTVQDSCGNTTEFTDYHVTYNGQPLYFYAQDTSPNSAAGANIPNWDLASASLIPQMPLIRNPMPALPTTIQGLTPGSHGYVLDLNGTDITLRGGLFWQFLVHPTTYADGVGDQLTPNLGDNNVQMWCSNNQIQWHLADLDPVSHGRFEGTVPGSCYGDYYYFIRFEKRGPTTGDPGTIWTYSGLFTTAGERVDPRNRATKRLRGANWMRFRHPHPPDGRTEFIGDAIANSSLLAGLARFTMETVDSGSGMQINSSIPVIRYEALENGHQPNVSPIYNYNKGSCCGTDFDYGNVVTFEITGVAGGISSQTYSTHIDAVVGVGFENFSGDPRLNLAGRAGTNMVITSNGPGASSEALAVFTQHVPSLTTEAQVDNFLNGFAELHNNDIGGDRCGRCHFFDGRGAEVVNTPSGPRIPPPLYGVGLLQWIEGAEAGLTWDGDVATVEQQVANALRNDHGVEPGSLGNRLTLIEDYTRFLSVPNRRPYHIDQPGVAEGQVLFHEVGCADCHWENQRTRSDAPEWARDIVISPFTDMKIHNIGTGGSFRTAPLWGIGTNMELPGASMRFLHDGRAASVSAAINAHGGEAANVMSNYNGLSGAEKSNIVKFIETL